MKRIKKPYIVTFSIILLLGIAVGIIVIYFPNLFKKHDIPKTVDVFGSPRAQTQKNFPATQPEFTAVIGDIKPASLHQQLIKVYKIGDTKKTAVFERPFYADGFRGNGLSYKFASSSAEIIQSGSLGTIGCTTNDCVLPWSNFYIWDTNNHTFSLDNASHKDEFQGLLTKYHGVDAKGCSIVGGRILSGQDDLSLTDIYKKYPTASYYCSQTQGIVPSNLIFFLQAEKTLEEIVGGDNIGSDDIRDSEL